MIINNNLTALSALNATKAANDMVSKSIKPLATGLKINSASDDASGLSISEKIRSQIKGADMAVKYAQDGISLLRVADGALGRTDDILHRMRELSVQAGNDTLTLQDRTQIQEEIDGLRGQLDEISRYTDFNKKKLLNGSAGALWSSDDTKVKIRVHGSLLTFSSEGHNHNTVNAGANYRIEVRSDPGKAQVKKSNIMSVTETMFIDSEDDNGQPIEVYYDKSLREIEQFYDSEGKFIVSEPQSLALVQGNGKTAGIVIYGDDTLRDTASKINDAIAFGLGQSEYADDAHNFAVISDGAGMTSESVYSRSAMYDPDGCLTGYDIKSTLVVRSAVQGRDGEIYFAGSDALIKAFGLNTIQPSQEGTFNISVYNAHTGEAVAADINITGHELAGIIHPNVDIDFDPMAGTVATWNENGREYMLISDGVYSANIHLASSGILFQSGANQDESFAVQLSNVSSETLGADRVNVMTGELARRSVGYIDSAIDSVVRQRTQIVAYTSALEHTLQSVNVAGENLRDSVSRITDADYAKSTMRYIEFQILSRAGEAVLSQANQQPEAVFSLLRN